MDFSDFPVERATSGHGLPIGELLVFAAAVTLAAVFGWGARAAAERRRRQARAHAIYDAVSRSLDAALMAGPHAGVHGAAQVLEQTLQAQYGPIFALSESLKQALKPLTNAINDIWPVASPPPPRFRHVAVTEAEVSLPIRGGGDPSLAGAGVSVAEVNLTPAQQAQERWVRIFAALQTFAVYWRNERARIAEIEALQNHIL